MSIAIKDLPHYTYEDWILWEGKWELFAGHPVAMSPTAVPRHQQVAAALCSELYFALKSCKHCKAYNPVDYKISDDTILVPDVLVICGKPTKKFLDFTPSLVAEILSPGTALRDRHTKFEIYEQQGVKYYLILDAEKNEVEIFELRNGKYQLSAMEQTIFRFDFDEDSCVANINFREIFI